nr:hypothetical protein [Solirubrobacter soli]
MVLAAREQRGGVCEEDLASGDASVARGEQLEHREPPRPVRRAAGERHVHVEQDPRRIERVQVVQLEPQREELGDALQQGHVAVDAVVLAAVRE